MYSRVYSPFRRCLSTGVCGGKTSTIPVSRASREARKMLAFSTRKFFIGVSSFHSCYHQIFLTIPNTGAFTSFSFVTTRTRQRFTRLRTPRG